MFVFSVVGVLRGDLFGTRVTQKAGPCTPPEPQPAVARESKAPKRDKRTPRLGAGHRGPAARHHHRARLAVGAHRPQPRVDARARRRLRLGPARADLPAGRRVVRRGPRQHQRHLLRPAAHHRRAGAARGRVDAAHRHHRPRACAGSRWPSRCATPPGPTWGSAATRTTRTPGTPGRTCSRSATAWAGTPAATSPARSPWAAWWRSTATPWAARRSPSLAQALREANQQIAARAEDEPVLAGMGTTATVLVRYDSSGAGAHRRLARLPAARRRA
nr:hypothetical protein [Angustibacter aerolatus]